MIETTATHLQQLNWLHSAKENKCIYPVEHLNRAKKYDMIHDL
ncbi:hypothetical protein [Candidatus Venteria ishoeyi]|nr:hypothetical protein [Candidatus Venteria ishoeyi]